MKKALEFIGATDIVEGTDYDECLCVKFTYCGRHFEAHDRTDRSEEHEQYVNVIIDHRASQCLELEEFWDFVPHIPQIHKERV